MRKSTWKNVTSSHRRLLFVAEVLQPQRSTFSSIHDFTLLDPLRKRQRAVGHGEHPSNKPFSLFPVIITTFVTRFNEPCVRVFLCTCSCLLLFPALTSPSFTAMVSIGGVYDSNVADDNYVDPDLQSMSSGEDDDDDQVDGFMSCLLSFTHPPRAFPHLASIRKPFFFVHVFPSDTWTQPYGCEWLYNYLKHSPCSPGS